MAAFAAAEIAPLPAPADDDVARRQARDILATLGAGGWIRWAIPEAWGGRAEAPDLRACCLVREALAAASPLADAVFALQCLGSMPITLGGSDAQRAAWLPRVARGEAMTAFAMTEPEAGSDVSGARHDRAPQRRRMGARGPQDAHLQRRHRRRLLRLRRDKRGGEEPRRSPAFSSPPTRPGLRFAGAQVMAAPHPLGELAFDGCRLPADALLGEENAGFKLGMRTLDRLRPTVAAAACGMAARALDEALAHARERRQFGQPLASFQLVQEKLASMATELTAARLLTYRAAWEADRGAERITLEAAMAKAYATEAAQRIVDQAVQILGGRGVLADNPVDRLYRAVRALRIYEGTTEVQHLVIARQLLGS